MSENNYCPMIHAGLQITIKNRMSDSLSCCMLDDKNPHTPPVRFVPGTNFFNDSGFSILRNLNKQGKLDHTCINNCIKVEQAHGISLRKGMINGLGISTGTDFSGPSRLDITFDANCNLACRSCGPDVSTYWQKHLREHNLWQKPVDHPLSSQLVIDALTGLDLSNLKMVVFCGGETLLGSRYWEITKWLIDRVPDAKNQLTVCFQTNATQSIDTRYYEIINKLKLVKLLFSVDGTHNRFEYLRWPAKWDQVETNMLDLRKNAPSNVMFTVEETISIFNLYYNNEVAQWVRDNYSTNREGDVVNHGRHPAFGIFNLGNLTQSYCDALQQSNAQHLIPINWKENPDSIRTMIAEIKRIDALRNESFEKTFPEVAEFYSDYL